jgi:threonyl-tRNA synthetase
MRESVIKKIPFTLILGDKERDSKSISYRLRGSNETFNLSQEEFLDKLHNDIKNKVR